MPSFEPLFTNLPSDVRRPPSVTNGVWIGGTGAIALAAPPQDRRITAEASGSLGLEPVLDGGMASGRSVTVGRDAQTLTLGPMMVPGGCGVTVTKVGPR